MPSNRTRLKEFRHSLHLNAELYNYEMITSSLISDYVTGFKPDRVIKFNHGSAYVWDSNKPGETIMFRADIDALPIKEETDEYYMTIHYGTKLETHP
jgi:metal-dependent amidase/aminoacylase/carboxypeptidase family protein